MFDIGFWELALIGVVAMLVIGPERLPGVARTAGLWFGRMRRFVGSVKADIDKELRAEELKRIMAQQAESSGIHEIVEETREAVKGVEQTAAELEKQDDAASSTTTQPETASVESQPESAEAQPASEKITTNDKSN